MAGVSQPRHVLYLTNANGDWRLWKAQWAALGISIRDRANGTFALDSTHPNNTFLKESIIVFTGNVDPFLAWSDHVYSMLDQLEAFGATVVCLTGPKDTDTLLPIAQLPDLPRYLDNELYYWIHGNLHQIATPLSHQSVLHYAILLNSVMPLLPGYRHALENNRTDIFLQNKTPQIHDILKNIHADKVRDEYIRTDTQFLSQLMHVAPGKISFLEYLLTDNHLFGLWQFFKKQPEYLQLAEKLTFLRHIFQTYRFHFPLDRQHSFSEIHRIIYTCYFHWSVYHQQDKGHVFKDKTMAQIQEMALQYLEKVLSGDGACFTYLCKAYRSAHAGGAQPVSHLTHTRIGYPDGWENANPIQRDFWEAWSAKDWHRLMPTIHRLIVRGRLFAVHPPIPALPAGDSIEVLPFQSALPAATYPLSLTWHPNGSALFALTPMIGDTHALTLRQHRLSQGVLSMVVMQDGPLTTCTQATLFKDGKYTPLKNVTQIPLDNNRMTDDTIHYWWSRVYPQGEANEFLEGIVLHHPRKVVLTEQIWGAGGVPAGVSSKKLYIIENLSEYRLVAWCHDDVFQKSHPVPKLYLKAMTIWQYIVFNQTTLTEAQRFSAAEQLESIYHQMPGASALKSDIRAMFNEITPLPMNLYLPSMKKIKRDEEYQETIKDHEEKKRGASLMLKQ